MLGFIATAARAMNTYNFPAGKLTPREVSITLDRACVDKNNKTYNRYKKDLSGLFILMPSKTSQRILQYFLPYPTRLLSAWRLQNLSTGRLYTAIIFAR